MRPTVSLFHFKALGGCDPVLREAFSSAPKWAPGTLVRLDLTNEHWRSDNDTKV
jgi:hypothetical protein